MACVSGLKVSSISVLKEENGPNHHTEDYEGDALVVRRGNSFLLDITHEGFDEERDIFYLQLKAGRKGKKRDGSLMEIHNKETSKDSFYFQISSKTDTNFRVSVTLPADCLVSCYTLSVVSYLRKNNKKAREEYECEQPVYILFNPWCKDDEVYMADDKLKEEYVLNDSGAIWWGGQRPKRWFFGQFKEAALKVTFKLLELNAPRRRDTAREVSRLISSRCNSCDNDGLLVGNWSGDYDGGEKPWKWAGSVRIFDKYLETGSPVEYGQCWVFSGLTTSMMRCLGIPARSVTNYDSAHDTDANCTFDKYFDEDGSYMEDESADSCWNFHVWNDVWMTRPDLPRGYGGWQAIDGTPQEESRGIYQCGPASLQAIKEGEIQRNYDTPFIFSEVNADTIYWQKNDNKATQDDMPWLAIRIKKNNVGTSLITRTPSPYSWSVAENVVDQYKYKEGSLLERAVIRKALAKADNPVVEEVPKDVMVSSKLKWNVSCDEPIDLKVTAVNTASKPLSLSCAITAQVIRYNGVKIKTLKPMRKELELAANHTEVLDFQYDPTEYAEHVDEQVAIRFVIAARIQETRQSYVTTKICNIHKPEITLELVDKDAESITAGEEIQVKINLPSVLGLDTFTNSSIDIDCPIVDNVTFDLGDMSGNGCSVTKPLTVLNVKKLKDYELVATFNSKEISGISGALKLNVKAK